MLINVLVIIILIILNAYFAGSEMALVSVNETKIRMMIESGNKKAESVKHLLKEPSKFLSTIQIGITLAGFLSSAFASEAFADRLVAWVMARGIEISASVLKPVAVVLITLYFLILRWFLVSWYPKDWLCSGQKSYHLKL